MQIVSRNYRALYSRYGAGFDLIPMSSYSTYGVHRTPYRGYRCYTVLAVTKRDEPTGLCTLLLPGFLEYFLFLQYPPPSDILDPRMIGCQTPDRLFVRDSEVRFRRLIMDIVINLSSGFD